MKRVKEEFFARDTLVVAKELLGKILCRRIGDKVLKGMIVETEAYTQDDPACHAFCGVTKRSETLFKKPGTLYIYFIYGMHYCANLVTDREGYGSGVLLRALEPLENIEKSNGPSLLCKAMSIDLTLKGIDTIAPDSDVWVEDYKEIPENNIVQTTRIGIKKAADYPRRFYVKDNKWVSKK